MKRVYKATEPNLTSETNMKRKQAALLHSHLVQAYTILRAIKHLQP